MTNQKHGQGRLGGAVITLNRRLQARCCYPCTHIGRWEGPRLRSLNRTACVLLVCSLTVCQPVRAANGSYNAGVDAWRKKDYPEAAKQWSQAVLTGNIDAMNNLAYLYFYGLGMPARISDAIQLWRVAAFAGESESQWHLGRAYEDGKGVEKDALKAYAWYRCSVHNARRKKDSDKRDIEAGIEQDALKSLQLLESRLSADELQRAGGLADDYIRRYGTAAPL